MLSRSRLQEDGGGVSVNVGGAPLDAPPLHPQLLLDLLHFGLQQPLLGFQTLLLRLAEAAVASPVEPEESQEGKTVVALIDQLLLIRLSGTKYFYPNKTAG